jgi:hypothetical protein
LLFADDGVAAGRARHGVTAAAAAPGRNYAVFLMK